MRPAPPASLLGLALVVLGVLTGDALTLWETIVDFNPRKKRGRTKDLTAAELDERIAFVSSL